MAVFLLARCIARADGSRSPAGCRWAALSLAPASPLPDGVLRAWRWGFVRRPGPLRTAPGAMGLGLPFPGPEAPGEEPTRSHAVAPIRSSRRRGSRGEPVAMERHRSAATSHTAAPSRGRWHNKYRRAADGNQVGLLDRAL